MNYDKNNFDFFIKVIFQEWKIFGLTANFASIASLLIAYNTFKDWPLSKFIFIYIIILLITFIIKIIRQSYFFYMGINFPIKAIRIVKGDGSYKGNDIIVLTRSTNIKKDQLLTLYCSSSGACQPICIIKIIDINKEHTLAIQINNFDLKLVKYFEEESRRQKVFALPEVDSKILIGREE